MLNLTQEPLGKLPFIDIFVCVLGNHTQMKAFHGNGMTQAMINQKQSQF